MSKSKRIAVSVRRKPGPRLSLLAAIRDRQIEICNLARDLGRHSHDDWLLARRLEELAMATFDELDEAVKPRVGEGSAGGCASTLR